MAAGLLVTAVSAGSNFDCDAAYKNCLELLKSQNHGPEQVAALSRLALRVYHACQTGDVEDIQGLFKRVERSILEVKGANRPATN